MNNRPKNSFSMSYASRKVIFPGATAMSDHSKLTSGHMRLTSGQMSVISSHKISDADHAILRLMLYTVKEEANEKDETK